MCCWVVGVGFVADSRCVVFVVVVVVVVGVGAVAVVGIVSCVFVLCYVWCVVCGVLIVVCGWLVGRPVAWFVGLLAGVCVSVCVC